MKREDDVSEVDDATEHRERRIGRPSKSTLFTARVTEWLTEEPEVMIRETVPADLLAGVILSIIARLAGHGPDPEPHTAAIATGALVGCAYRYGERQGAALHRAAVASSPAPVPALLPAQPAGVTYTVIAHPLPNGGRKP